MPKEYTDIKKSYEKKGKSKEEAESIAAATYNKYIAPKKKDSRPVGNKAQQRAGTAVECTLITDLLVENENGVNMIPAGTKIAVEGNVSVHHHMKIVGILLPLMVIAVMF